MSELPSGTVTFLFTDLEGSTVSGRPTPTRCPLRGPVFDQILDDAIAAHDGVVVKRTGDGVHAVFVTADDAVRAAVAAQRNLAAEHWDVIEPLTVRVGLYSRVEGFRAAQR